MHFLFLFEKYILRNILYLMCYVKYYIFSISLRFSCDIITTERVRNGKNIVKFLIHCPQENIIFQNFIL